MKNPKLTTSNHQQFEMNSEPCGLSVTHERRTAYYKPNIWSNDFVQSLTTEFSEVTYRKRVQMLLDEFKHIMSGVAELSSKARAIDTVMKLGLSNVLHKEIKDVLDFIVSKLNTAGLYEDDLLGTPLTFRLLRQYGYKVSQDMLINYMSEMELMNLKNKPHSKTDVRGILELFEASQLGVDGEETMVKAKAFSSHYLIANYLDMDVNLAKQVTSATELPCHRKVLWFDVRHQIQTYEQGDDKNPILLELAKLNFNVVQAMHLAELKELSRWWKNLGLIENIGFTRDRLVESFLWTVGAAYEPQHALLRKCVTKVVTFILLLDDAYDIYGSLEELEVFTRTVERWDAQEIDQLPECMRICFNALITTTNEIANEIQKERGLNDIILPFLQKAWADFCKALLVEAEWYKKRYVPSLENYMSWAWITSSGPLLSLTALLCTAHGSSEELKDNLEHSHDLIYTTSLIIRLLNDLGTSDAELERGDAQSSIMCYMAEANVTEGIARGYMQKMIGSAWSKINMELINANEDQKTFVNLVINMARVCHFIYQKGDGFGVQDGDTKIKIKHLLIEPLNL